jgi:hypothetical protein
MYNKCIKFAAIWATCLSLLVLAEERLIVTENINDKVVTKIDKYLVHIPQSILSEVKMDNPGIGSSLKLHKKDDEGNLWFYAMSDRGFNIDAPLSTTGQTVKVFPFSNFYPFISSIKLVPGKSATIEKTTNLGLTGLPPRQEASQAAIEVPLTLELEEIKSDSNGIDSEGIDIDKDKNFWIADEYGPRLVKVSPAGKIIENIDYTNGMPKILQHRAENRGIESIAISPSGKIYFAAESILNINNETDKTAEFIRIIELDQKTRKTRMFAYMYDKDIYQSKSAVKIGDLVAIDDNRFLVIEQGKKKDGSMRNTIQLIDLSQSTDISSIKLPDGRELEYACGKELNLINPAKKQFILDVTKYKWPHEKLEGIAYIDNKHVGIINDNDFGNEIEFVGAKDQDKANYRIDLEKKVLLYKGKPTDLKISYKPTHIKTHLWIIELAKPII